MTPLQFYLHGIWIAFLVGCAYRSLLLTRLYDRKNLEPWSLHHEELDQIALLDEKNRSPTRARLAWWATILSATIAQAFAWPLWWPLEWITTVHWHATHPRAKTVAEGMARVDEWFRRRDRSGS